MNDDGEPSVFGRIVILSWAFMMYVSYTAMSAFVHNALGIHLVVVMGFFGLFFAFPMLVLGVMVTVMADEQWQEFWSDEE